MENKAHYALIGTFVLLSFVAGISFIAWLSNSQFDRQYNNYEVEFNGPVRGLSQGSEVRLNGLMVGEVTKLRFDRNDPNNVIVEIQVVEGTPIFKDSSAQLEPQGLTGLSYLQISPGDVSTGDLPEMGDATIPGEMSQLDTFLDGTASLIDGAQNALGNVTAAFDEEAKRDFQAILDNIAQITSNLRDLDIDGEQLNRTLAAFEQAANNAAIAAQGIDTTADDISLFVKQDLTELITRAKTSLDVVDDTLVAFEGFADGGNQLTVDARDAVNRLSNSGLTDLEETADGLRRLVEALSAVAEQLEQNPVAFIAGQEQEIMELPQ